MQTARLEIDRAQAALLYRQYREHRTAYNSTDLQIEKIYRAISRGAKVVRALESIRQGGVDVRGLPHLAIIRADATDCYLLRTATMCQFAMDRWPRDRATLRFVRCPMEGTAGMHLTAKARVPLIPVHHRPAADQLSKYHLLFEADWRMEVKPDPMLLRRLGTDVWVVVAAWDLTPVELAVLG